MALIATATMTTTQATMTTDAAGCEWTQSSHAYPEPVVATVALPATAFFAASGGACDAFAVPSSGTSGVTVEAGGGPSVAPGITGAVFSNFGAVAATCGLCASCVENESTPRTRVVQPFLYVGQIFSVFM